MMQELDPSISGNVHLFEKFIYEDPDMSSSVVSKHTSDIFLTYFKKKKPLTSSERDYLAHKTLPFIDSVRAGLASHPKKIDRLGIASLEDYVKAITVDRPSVLPPDETLEAFDIALITMGMMPDVTVRNAIDMEGKEQSIKFSRRGMLRPPETLEQTRQRIQELWMETLKIGEEWTPRRINFINNPQVTRTTLFFDVCRSIPLKNEIGMQRDVEIYLSA